ATEKELAIDETRKLITEANRLWRNGNYTEAFPLAERALAVREKELGTENLDVSQAVLVLANLYDDKGDYDRAELFYQRALKIREKLLGKDHISVSLILNNFATLYKDKGEYGKAEPLLLRALEIREKELEPNHLLIASVLLNLGNLSKEKNDKVKAALYYQRVLEIREKALGAESVEVADALNNIANLYDDVARAEPLYLRVLAIKEKFYGPDHQETGQTLYNLAVLYAENGNFEKAKPLCERSLAILEKTIGAEHPYTSYPLNLLALIYKNTGDYAKAESLYLRSIAIKEKTQGPDHPFLGGAISNLAGLYAVKGEIDKAIATQTRANAILEYNARLNLPTGSEREKVSYLQTLLTVENQTLWLNVKIAPTSAAAAELALTTILQRKGRVLDAMSDNLSVLRRRFNKEDQLLLDDLNDTTTRLVGLVLEGSQKISADEYQKKIKELEQKRENLESEISRRSAGFYQQTKPVTLAAIQETIPENAALIEIVAYRPIAAKGSEFGIKDLPLPEALENLRYIVYVVRKQGEVKWKDLGEAKPIDASINLFRQALRDPKRQDVGQLARAVDEKVMSPIRAFLGDASQLLISPDGLLNLIPFEALIDAQNHYLIEKYAVTYLTSGRDLLRLQTPRESKSNPLLIANPSFDLPDETQTAKLTKPATRNAKRQSLTATRSLSDTYFAPLGGTMQEARSIQTLFPDATFLTGAQATESALKQITAPRILHIATHGFFLPDDETSGNAKIENPLLRSGLALAGANQRKSGGDDGILTALEASGLNLWGTKLVVLSACDTGLGEVRNGEGVYGLRRAFVLAGTESLVMSLWPVSDYVTRRLMTDYYKNLKQGMGRGAALRQVQLEMLKEKEHRHPFYWASFIQSGEWANLDGKR
ncbi:MAG: CHAT domain-containing tetratricopeptide repeat protein, partial [Actinomycetota bacterium]